MKRILHHLTYLPAVLITFALCQCESESSLDISTEKKILIRANQDEPSGLDPQVVTGICESNILRAMFEGLCVEDPLNATIHRPGAAESWTTNKDFTEWVFKLQPDAKWSDGEEVTAEDFIFSYRRILSPKFGSKNSFMLYYIVGAEDYNKDHKELFIIKNNSDIQSSWEALQAINFRGDNNINMKQFESSEFSSLDIEEKKKWILGNGLNQLDADALTAIQQNPSLFAWPESINSSDRQTILATYIAHYGQDMWKLANVGVTAINKHTLKIKLRSSVPFLPDLSKHFSWYPVPKHVILKHGEFDERRTEWTEPNNIVSNGPFKMKTWKFNYKIELEKNPLYWDTNTVKLNGIVFLPISNAYTEARMFYNDQIHISDALAPELIEYSREKYSDVTQQETYLGTNFLRFNNKHEALSDSNLRKAFAYATDAESLIKYVFKGGQQVATGIVPPMGKYEPKTDFSFNPTKAKEFFAKTTYANTPKDLKIILLTTNKENSKTLAEALQAMWFEHLGVDVKIEQREWASYITRMSKLDYGIATGNWLGDYPDPTTFLNMWKKGNGSNRTGWSSEEYEVKLKEAELTKDPMERLKTLQDAEAIYMADMPIVPIYWYTSNYLLDKSVKNWNPMIMKNQPYKFLDLQKTH